MPRERIYNIWRGMVGRCHNENWNNFYTKTYYRDKGIKVCDEWRYDFETFREWAYENGYQDDLSIDRIDSDGDYCPENCRWITLSENRRRALSENRRRAVQNRSVHTRNLNSNKKGQFMVALEVDRHFYKVIQIGLHKSAALKIVDELNEKNITLPYRCFITNGAKVGEVKYRSEVRLYLQGKKRAEDDEYVKKYYS